jgi:hypothetical protein
MSSFKWKPQVLLIKLASATLAMATDSGLHAAILRLGITACALFLQILDAGRGRWPAAKR